MSINQRCRLVQVDECESRWLAGDRVRFLLESDHTGGVMSLGDVEVYPGAGPPPHMHTREDEIFYVVDGEFAFIRGDAAIRAGRGFAAMMPRNLTHTFKCVGATPGRLVVLAMPGGFDSFAKAVSQPWTGPRAPTSDDIEKLLAVCPKFGIEIRPTWQTTRTLEPKCDDRQLWVMGNHVQLKLTGSDTNGQTSVCLITQPPGAIVPPHAHIVEDEMFLVLEGTAEFEIEGRRIPVVAGGFVHVPRGTVHGFANRGATSMRLLDYHTPAGFENFFLEIGEPCSDPARAPSTSIDMRRAGELFKKYGMTLPG